MSRTSKSPEVVEIEFDPDRMIREFAQVAKDYKDGTYRQKYRTRVVEAKPVGRIDAQRILELREGVFHMSRGAFASVLNVPSDTLRKWETGKRNPSGAARRILDLLSTNPGVAREFVRLNLDSTCWTENQKEELATWLKTTESQSADLYKALDEGLKAAATATWPSLPSVGAPRKPKRKNPHDRRRIEESR
jgi:putative transcriptional regulator